MSKLEPLLISEGIEMYLQDRALAASTMKTHRKRLERFEDWCCDEDIYDLNDVSGRLCHRYKIDDFAEKKDGGEYSDETIRGYLDTLRVFLRWAEAIDGVEKGTSEKINSPRPGKSRDITLEEDRGEAILEHLDRYQYASLDHAIAGLFWECGMRVGAVRAIDVDDVHLDEQFLAVRHRPETDTALKNGVVSERDVALSDALTTVLRDYIQTHRIDSKDEHGRSPLLSSHYGRRHTSNLRSHVYGLTRPCMIGGCPHDREIEECNAAVNVQNAQECPDTVSPHPLRRASITRHLREDVPKVIVSDRMDVSPDVLDEHYDVRSRTEKMEQRRQYLPD